MGTMRHDRTSLWNDPRISATEVLDALKKEETRGAFARARTMPVAFGFAGAALVAALGLKIVGLERAAKVFALFVPPLLVLGFYEEVSRIGPTAG